VAKGPPGLATARLVLVGGDDAFAKAALLRELVAGARSGDEAVAAQAGERPLPELLAEVSTPPFFAERRSLVVSGIETIDPAPFGGALGSLPDTALVVLVMGEPGRGQRGDGEGRTTSHAAAWRKAVQAAGGEVVTLDFDRSGLASDLRAQAKRLGKELAPANAQALAEMTGSDPAVASAELRKLAAYVGDAPSITGADLAAVVTPEPEYSVFALVDDVVAGRTGKALEQFRRLSSTAKDLKGEVLPRLIPMMTSRLRLVRQARALMDAGLDPARPGEGAAAWLPEGSVATERDWLRKKAVDAARKLDRERLAHMLAILVQTDARLKGIAPALDEREAVEDAIVQMSQAASAR
jgi:DNA polymerase III delta subunit